MLLFLVTLYATPCFVPGDVSGAACAQGDSAPTGTFFEDGPRQGWQGHSSRSIRSLWCSTNALSQGYPA